MDMLIWFFFGEAIIAVLAVLLISGCLDVLGTLIGFPEDGLKIISHLLIKYFWPAMVATGYMTLISRRKKEIFIVAIAWVLILVLFCFIPGSVPVPDSADVAQINVNYAYNIFEVRNTVNYEYTGHAVTDPTMVAQLIEMFDGAKYRCAHEDLLTNAELDYDRLIIEFLNADGDIIQELELIKDGGIRVPGRLADRFYRIKKGTGFDSALLNDIAYNGI